MFLIFLYNIARYCVAIYKLKYSIGFWVHPGVTSKVKRYPDLECQLVEQKNQRRILRIEFRHAELEESGSFLPTLDCFFLDIYTRQTIRVSFGQTVLYANTLV